MRVRVVVRAEDSPRPASGHVAERHRAQRPAASPGRGSSHGVDAEQGPYRSARGVLLRGAGVQRLVHVRAARAVHREYRRVRRAFILFILAANVRRVLSDRSGYILLLYEIFVT